MKGCTFGFKQFAGLVLGLLLAGAAPGRAAVDWAFQTMSLGRALVGGGWQVTLPVGGLRGSPEFSPGLQLVYLNVRPDKGVFGGNWFCPQLESRVLPRDKGVLEWRTPGGALVYLIEDKEAPGTFRESSGGLRTATFRDGVVVIRDEDGWSYRYEKSRLTELASPTRRSLLFVRGADGALQTVVLRDDAGGGKLTLLEVETQAKTGLVTGWRVAGQQWGFEYAMEGRGGPRLTRILQPTGPAVDLGYEHGVLASLRVGNGTPVRLVTEFVPPSAKGRPEPEAKLEPAHWWLIADDAFTYSYGKSKDGWNADEIAIESRTGIRRRLVSVERRGQVTLTGPEGERKSFYYIAPGQRYDGRLRRVEVDGKLQVEYRYDRRTGLLNEIVDGDGRVTLLEYPPEPGPAARPVSVKRGTSRDSAKEVGRFTYDAAGRLTSATDLETGAVTRIAWNGRGDLAGVTDALGATTEIQVDGFGRVQSASRGGLTERVEFDDTGRILRRTAPDGLATRFEYDATGRPARVWRQDTLLAEYLRDETGLVTGEKDALGRVHRTEENADGRTVADCQANGSVTRFEYDALGRQVAMKDGNGHAVRFAHDAFGNVVKQTTATGQELTWLYDGKGGLNGRGNGVQNVSYTRDDKGRTTAVDYGVPGERVEYSFDDEGRLSTAASPAARVDYYVDAADLPSRHHVTGIRQRQGNFEQSLRLAFNVAGQRTALVLTDLPPPPAAPRLAQQTEYRYDTLGRLTGIRDGGEEVAGFEYDPGTGRLARKRFGNGITAAYGHDPLGRLARVEFTGGPLNAPLVLAYDWDAAGQLTRRAWNGEAQRFEYDAAGQLLKVVGDKSGAELEVYRYDPAGNMLEKTVRGQKSVMTYSDANQLLSIRTAGVPGTLVYRYDAAGRVVAKEQVPDGKDAKAGGAVVERSEYGWLDKTVLLERAGGEGIRFTYWPDGQLAAKTLIPRAAAAPEKKAGVAAAAADAGGTLFERMTWDGLALLRRNDEIFVAEPHVSGGVPVCSHATDAPRRRTWYLNDMLGTTLATVGPDGRVEPVSLTAFGQPLRQTAAAPKPEGLSVGGLPAGAPAAPNETNR